MPGRAYIRWVAWDKLREGDLYRFEGPHGLQANCIRQKFLISGPFWAILVFLVSETEEFMAHEGQAVGHSQIRKWASRWCQTGPFRAISGRFGPLPWLLPGPERVLPQRAANPGFLHGLQSHNAGVLCRMTRGECQQPGEDGAAPSMAVGAGPCSPTICLWGIPVQPISPGWTLESALAVVLPGQGDHKGRPEKVQPKPLMTPSGSGW